MVSLVVTKFLLITNVKRFFWVASRGIEVSGVGLLVIGVGLNGA